MAPKPDHSKPLTTDLGRSLMTQPMIDTLINRGVLARGDGRPPSKGETKANPKPGEVVVFHYLFSTSLYFPLDPVVIEILEGYRINFHQLTLNAFVRLGLYSWVSKTCRLKPTAEGFAFAHRVHFQRKTVLVSAEGKTSSEGTEAEAQYGCYNFTYRDLVSGLVAAYMNKWEDWTSFWFYHKAPTDASGSPCSLVGKKVEALTKTCPSFDIEEKPEHRAFVSVLRDISKVFGTRDLTEEYVACKCWPLRVGWSVGEWGNVAGGIPMLDFGKCFGLTKESK
ncbi:hypothetical protein C2845_PM15G01960 [Panicum miliaceum]|uniref:Retrotransposon protein, putative, unclassified n=1 Tax=Panicum miliaceum TaxID=4540 RepID=A0A3L6Q345_PANMI|nr:hypothetical protein C2845_PM15G01960 [Panicum miliaceum]